MTKPLIPILGLKTALTGTSNSNFAKNRVLNKTPLKSKVKDLEGEYLLEKRNLNIKVQSVALPKRLTDSARGKSLKQWFASLPSPYNYPLAQISPSYLTTYNGHNNF